jgi:tRNA pseudouridine38-40 synthase
MAVRNIKLTIQYDGLKYSGWQAQTGKRTIQGQIEQAVSELTRVYTKVKGASRTDAGVSALGQVAHFSTNCPIPEENFAKAINHRLPSDIRVLDAAVVGADFDVSADAKRKHYRYTICAEKRPNILKIRNCWHRPGKLDVSKMQKAAEHLIGEKDFKSFASAADKRKSSVRTVFKAEFSTENDWIYFDIEGDGFLYNMVRNIVGTLVEIGRGRWRPEKITEILNAKDRASAGPIAPAQGLCLMKIEY